MRKTCGFYGRDAVVLKVSVGSHGVGWYGAYSVHTYGAYY
jgi:hypothetical protein